MADFIAVIRRAVDGLAENTPEMRVKVYDRARGAVQRQLENMKPRPPEAMLQRQMEKLDAAIREVEAEHASAVADEDMASPGFAPAPAAPAMAARAPEPEPLTPPPPVAEPPAAQGLAIEPPIVPEPERASPAFYAPEPVSEPEPEPAPAPAPQYHPQPEQPADASYSPPVFERHPAEPAAYEPAAPEPVQRQEPWPEPHWAASEPRPVEPPATETSAAGTSADETWRTETWPTEPRVAEPMAPEPAAYEPAAHEPAAYEPGSDQPQAPEPVAYEPVAPEPVAPEPVAYDPIIEAPLPSGSPEAFVAHSREEPLAAEADAHFDEPWHEPAATPTPQRSNDWVLDELHNLPARRAPEPVPQGHSNAAPAPQLDVTPEQDHATGQEARAPERRMPEANADFSWEAAAFDDLPAVNAAPEPAGSRPAEALTQEPPAPVGEPGWQEATPLRDYDRRGVVNEDDSDLGIGDMEELMSSKLQGKSFRMEPKRRRFGIGSLVAVIFLLALIGGGYAAWINREELTSMATGLVASAPVNSTAGSQANPTAGAAPSTDTPAASGAASPAGTETKPASTSLTDTLNPQKFTQRLMADGAEVDSGPAPVTDGGTVEGKSVARQTVASNEAPAATQAPANAPAANAPPAAADGTAPATQQPAGATEKMFLYEERVGQGSPTAIQGSVVWSLQHEQGQNGKQEAEVRGTVTVPGRNLTALLTFKRNNDSSLPASHIVEIVFSLPPNFEGGAIDSVQRISMKRTEQDRGDALVAVPAKITDDFHMIALNDYPDARKANLDLLSTRDWMDIPVTYRNGRRALLTLEKGATGNDAFTKAVAEWAAMGDATSQ